MELATSFYALLVKEKWKFRPYRNLADFQPNVKIQEALEQINGVKELVMQQLILTGNVATAS